MGRRVENDQGSAHACNRGRLEGFSGLGKPFVERLDGLVVLFSGYSGHVEGLSNWSAASLNHALPPALAAVPVERGYADKTGDLSTGQPAAFGHQDDQGHSRERIDPLCALVALFLFVPEGVLVIELRRSCSIRLIWRLKV